MKTKRHEEEQFCTINIHIRIYFPMGLSVPPKEKKFIFVVTIIIRIFYEFVLTNLNNFLRLIEGAQGNLKFIQKLGS